MTPDDKKASANRSFFVIWKVFPEISIFQYGDPTGTRTRVTAVRGRCPRPLDDRAASEGSERNALAISFGFPSEQSIPKVHGRLFAKTAEHSAFVRDASQLTITGAICLFAANYNEIFAAAAPQQNRHLLPCGNGEPEYYTIFLGQYNRVRWRLRAACHDTGGR
jgi:hypothetical protein